MAAEVVVPGIEIKKSNEYLIAMISELSDELKNIIRERFAAICHGEQYSLMNAGNYTYTRTVEEFLTRIKTKRTSMKTGMLGEFIIHVLRALSILGTRRLFLIRT